MKGRCDPDYYQVKKEQLQLLEERSCKGEIELYYGDETQVSEEGYVPYGWQYKEEQVSIASAKGGRINCFGLLSRKNDFVFKTTQQTITADFVIAELDWLSWHIAKPTVIVLDNARVHRNKKMKAIQRIWAERGLFIFFLPPYSPHLNIIERLWKEVKGRWLSPQDYGSADQLFYTLTLLFHAVGDSLNIRFNPSG